MTLTKIDFKKTMKEFYNPSSKDFTLIDVPPFPFLMIDGEGAPGGSEYANAVQALYSVAYTIKFTSKKELGMDFTVAPLEGLWWADDMGVFMNRYEDKSDWKWTAMIMQPDHITQAIVDRAVSDSAKKKDLPALPKLRFETYHEGLCVQILHIGPYSAEGPTLKRLHLEYLPANGYVEAGKHHEIYLSDPNRSAPEKMKTVLRQPVKRK